MVLRTVFLPPQLDDKLRDYAYTSGVSKGDLIRTLVRDGLVARLNDPDSFKHVKLEISEADLLKLIGFGSPIDATRHHAVRKAAKRVAKKPAKKAAKKPVRKSAKKVAKKPAKKAARKAARKAA